MNDHVLYMFRCLELAAKGEGSVAPNPMVGAVLVYDGRIIGEGYHEKYGQSHAEVNCINDAEARYGINEAAAMLKKSRLYVSLEPCAHFGKTPPCADLIIKKQIPEVVIGCRDPFKQVDGRGIEKLKLAGIKVIVGVLERECSEINKRFFTFHTKHRPYIILKWAQTADGRIAGSGDSRILISNEITNRNVHKWRAMEASILIGTNTALKDDPSLTNRFWNGKSPVRLVLDLNLRLPLSLKVFDQTVRTIVFNTVKNDETESLAYYRLTNDGALADQIVLALFRLNIQSVLVEGGSTMIQAFIDSNLWDEARVITNSEMILRQGLQGPVMPLAHLADVKIIFSDTIHFLKPLPAAEEHTE